MLFNPSRLLAASLLALFITGCETPSFFDPGELTPGMNYRQKPLLKPILDNLASGIEEPSEEFVNASDVKPEDLLVDASDYVIGKSDVVSISITDLVAPGVETVKTARVSESGRLSLPLIGQIQADGLTEAQLEEQVIEAYRRANIIQKAQVSVTVAEARARTFSIMGSVGNQGQFAIVQSDFRMLDALVLARDVIGQPEFMYVLRQEEPGKAGPTTKPAGPATQPTDDLAPRMSFSAAGEFKRPTYVMQDVAPMEETRQPTVPAGPTTAPVAAEPATQPVVGDGGVPATPEKFEFKAPAGMPNTRVIKIPVASLKNGELKYNIVIRPRDMIVVPVATAGEYYMGGHVARVGVYSLTGRKITLKQAVVSAGMLDGLAIPGRTEVIRRIGINQELYVRVDLARVYSGEQPDMFLKPNDIVNVGTNFFAPFIAAIRGGFRFTYGFGFIYDRNYASDENFQ